jgi:hypothetical protein
VTTGGSVICRMGVSRCVEVDSGITRADDSEIAVMSCGSTRRWASQLNGVWDLTDQLDIRPGRYSSEAKKRTKAHLYLSIKLLEFDILQPQSRG